MENILTCVLLWNLFWCRNMALYVSMAIGILRKQHASHYRLSQLKLSFGWNARTFHCIIVRTIYVCEIYKWENTIQICYCYFNLQSLSRTIHTHFARTSFVHSIWFGLCWVFRAFVIAIVCVCVCVYRSSSEWNKKIKERTKSKSFSPSELTTEIDATVGSLYVTYVRLGPLYQFQKHTSAFNAALLHFLAFLGILKRINVDLKIH